MKDALVGFNTNVSRAGHVLHVQTEDSGRDRPHVMTHLFADGTILASKKSEYGHLVNQPDMAGQVRALMKAQHKAMIRELRDGVHDAVVERALGSAPAPDLRPAPPVEDRKEPAAAAVDAGAAAAAGAGSGAGERPRRDTGPRPPASRERSGFGRDLISDRSLDDVILSYLAEELTKTQK